jgi:hypothetical protein
MPWAKLDDRFHTNPKIVEVWTTNPAALGLHVLAMAYCAGEQTDGIIAPGYVKLMMPADRARNEAVRVLVDAGLWDIYGTGWIVHDWLKYNPSKVETEAKARARSEAGLKAARARWGSDDDA